MKRIISCILIMATSGCAVHPVPTYDPDDQRCNLSTRKTELSQTVVNVHCGGAPECAAGMAIIGVASALVSGSIVVVGNTVHWLEKQGKCDDSFLNKYILQHNQPLIENDGKAVNDGELTIEGG